MTKLERQYRTATYEFTTYEGTVTLVEATSMEEANRIYSEEHQPSGEELFRGTVLTARYDITYKQWNGIEWVKELKASVNALHSDNAWKLARQMETEDLKVTRIERMELNRRGN